ncbi:unnamed protein product [Adineta steineri]|uniref:NAD(P)(+)--arginine ADP-ribosyltransferase n=1 Tax=Adineta steineri TaxID=433720 RepID=A0A814N4U2_9BILA|nr:unnamed protein product [Adineta steineri]CAF1135192.1 unnamed protein product [Adineta steineri]CAF3665970.1 unnamed protein product [Adineta steineri]
MAHSNCIPSERFLDATSEPQRRLSPIHGYELKPLVSLEEAVRPFETLIPNIQAYVWTATGNCEQPKDGLTLDESAAVYLYTMECMYRQLNSALRSEDRQQLVPYFSYLKLFLTALWKLNDVQDLVFRGVKANISDDYPKGKRFAWWGLSSTTTSLDVLQTPTFLGESGPRTLFNIQCFNGKMIQNHSQFSKESEVLLLPCSYFEVMGNMKQGADLRIIHLKQIEPPVVLIQPPFPSIVHPEESTSNEKIIMTSSNLIERQAIGRSGEIGSLYDIRTDQFVMGNLFNDVLPDSFIRRHDNFSASYWVDFHNSQKETFDNLNIEANLKLALMTELLKVEESAKYLKQTKANSHTVRTTFIYNAKTKREDLQISIEGLHEYFSSHAFENPDVTHVVIGIIWGVNVAATFERIVEKHDDVKRTEDALKAAFANPAFSISGNADLESLKISFSGDILIENCPGTIDGVMQVCQNVPSMLKSLNDGKGQPLTYILYSLKQIAERTKIKQNITRMVKEVSKQIVDRIENIFEQINDEQRKLNDFLDEMNSWKEFLDQEWFDLVKQKLSDFNKEELKLKRELSSLLVDIRSNLVKESKMIELIDNFSKHPCSSQSIGKFFEENENIKAKIQTLKKN